MRVAVTSLVRYTGPEDPTGFVTVVDLPSRRVVFRAPVPERIHGGSDPNPRGGFRGAKGIDVADDRLVFANAERLFVIDRTWRLVGSITHPWMGGVHDILCEPDGIWVTCTNCDLLLRTAWDGRHLDSWDWRGDSGLLAELGLPAVSSFDPTLDYRDPMTTHGGVYNVAHVNAIRRDEQGFLVSFGRVMPAAALRKLRAKAGAVRLLGHLGLGARALALKRGRRGEAMTAPRMPVSGIAGSQWAIVRVANGGLPARSGAWRASVVLRGPCSAGVPNHNLARHGDLLLYNDSNEGKLVAREPDKATELSVPIPGSPSFPRGLAELGDGRLLVGGQRPASVHEVDLESGRIVASIPIGGDPAESVYGICVLPSSFDDPPASRTPWPSDQAAPPSGRPR